MSRRHPAHWIALAPLVEREARAREPAWLGELVTWVTEFIAKPHAELRRPGAVCPFVPPAIDRGLVFVSTGLVNTPAQVDALAAGILEELEVFLAAPPARPAAGHLYKAVLIALPQLTETADEVLPAARAKVKPALLERGVACADFYPQNVDGSVHNVDFPLGRAPVPNLVLRHVAAHDDMLLEAQPELREIFRRFLRRHEQDG